MSSGYLGNIMLLDTKVKPKKNIGNPPKSLEHNELVNLRGKKLERIIPARRVVQISLLRGYLPLVVYGGEIGG